MSTKNKIGIGMIWGFCLGGLIIALIGLGVPWYVFPISAGVLIYLGVAFWLAHS
jgi:hypothetical protein